MTPAQALIPVLVVLAGCSPSAYGETEQAGYIRDGIQTAYAPAPRPEWFGALDEVVVEGETVFVGSLFTEADQALAVTMCEDIALVSFGPEGQSIDVTRVRIYSIQNEEMVECEVPDAPEAPA